MSSFSKYPAYKPTTIPWLSKVPGHWTEIKVKYIFRERVKKGYPNEPLLAATQSMGVVTKDAYGERTVTAQKDLHLLKLVEKNDFVISLRSFQGGIEVSHARGIISPAYTILRISRECAPGYLAFLLKSAPFIDGLKLFITGIREGQNIDYARLARTYLPWPPVEEQHLIVRYLRALDAKVKRYIRTKRKLIAALQEQKQAIIQRAVTRGLDPNVKLKPSGVEWLGEVPEHWEVRKLKQMGTVRIGLTYSPGDLTGDNGTLVLRASNILNGRIVSADNVYVSKQIPDPLRVVKGDVLICVRSGSRSLVGKSAMIPEEFQGVSYGAFMSLFRGKHYEYVYWVLNSNLLPSVMAQFETSTINQLTQSDLRNLSIPLPPESEILQITSYLRSATSKVDKGIALVEKDLAAIKEYHTRLIADVVTGAVDVREAARKLPEEDQMIGRSEDQMMEEETLSLAAEGEAEYGEEGQ